MDALKLNNEGTLAFKTDDFKTAVEKFTLGIPLVKNPEEKSLLLSNRSSAHLKLQMYEEAVEDGQQCIIVRPDWPKGYLRLGKALEASGKRKEACEIYFKAINSSRVHKELLLKPLVELNDKCMHFSSDLIDLCTLMYEKYCIICRKLDQLSHCVKCKCVFYCSKKHQQQDWPRHKRQCKDLAVIVQEKADLDLLKIDVNTTISQYLSVKKPFQSLDINKWTDVWQHLELTLDNSSLKTLASEHLSWPLTLISSLQQFHLHTKSKLLIHVVGADNMCIRRGLFQNLILFPIPDIHIVLVGPELWFDGMSKPFEHTTCSGKHFTISVVKDLYHNYKERSNYIRPDLILAYHSGIHDPSYAWKPSLYYIVSEGIPSVFTAWSSEELKDYVNMLKQDAVKTNILLQGPAPFPSLMKSHITSRLEIKIRVHNSYWVCFQGGNPISSTDFDDMVADVMKGYGVSDLDINNLKLNGENSDLLKKLSPLGYDLIFSRAQESIKVGIERYRNNDIYGATNMIKEGLTIAKSVKYPHDDDEKSASLRDKMNGLVACAHCWLGNIAKKQHEYSNAKSEFENAIRIYPQCYEAHMDLALLCFSQFKDLNTAEEMIRKGIEILPTDPRAWKFLGDVLKSKGDVRGAEETFKKADEIRINVKERTT